jgi:hypothetical protein
MRSSFCARAANGHAIAPPRIVMNSRRLHCPSQAEEIVAGQTGRLEVDRLALGNVRFGSKAEVKTFYFNVRFTPKSGHGSAPL